MIANSSVKLWIRYALASGLFCLSITAGMFSQENQYPLSNSNQPAVDRKDDYKIKVGVEEVRLDVVVVDKKRRQISDLTAEDFRLYQDRKEQEIISCRYISLDPVQTGPPLPLSSEFEIIAPNSATSLDRNDVRRSIVFLVNDNNLGFQGIYEAREALRRYVQEDMQPGDLISIFRTSSGNATLQAFTSNKRELLSRIDSILWKPGFMDIGNEVDFAAMMGVEEGSDLRKGFGFAIDPLSDDRPDIQEIAIQYCINALNDMPGRKYIMLVTNQIYIGSDYWGDYRWRQEERYKQLGEMALRAGVVIHTLSAVGVGQVSSTQNFMPISEYTGGLFYAGFNFLDNGMEEANEMTRGYYLLSYIPPEKTFAKPEKNKYHDIKVKVKRKGATVFSRDGFYTVPAVVRKPLRTPEPPPLVEIMFSPFQYNSLNVSLASGYVDSRQEGYLMPTWMHLDGHNLRGIKEFDGTYSVAFEVGASTTDIDNIFQDYGDMDIGFQIDEKDIQKFRKNGINFTVSIPVKKAGGHYVRVAVKDRFSEAKGSAYEFIEIPDLKKNSLALSSLFIIDREEDASWIRSMTSSEPSGNPEASRLPSYKNPANKEFRPGESFDYMAVIYNAKIKKNRPPDLEYQVIVYRNGAGLFMSRPEPVDLGDASDFSRIPVRNRFFIDNSMQPGDYVLQFLLKDNLANKKRSLATQTLNFRIPEP